MHKMFEARPKVLEPKEHQNPHNGKDDESSGEKFVTKSGRLHHQVPVPGSLHDDSMGVGQPRVDQLEVVAGLVEAAAAVVFELFEFDARKHPTELNSFLQ